MHRVLFACENESLPEKKKLFTSKAPKPHNRKNLSRKHYLNELKSQHFLLSKYSNNGGYTGDLWTPIPFPVNLVYVLEMTVVTKY